MSLAQSIAHQKMGGPNAWALLVECDPGNTLGGSCMRDVSNMANALMEDCGFAPDHVVCLFTDECRGLNMREKLSVDGNARGGNSRMLFEHVDLILSQKPSFFLLLLSGHGFSIADVHGDEMDGMDEAVNIGGGVVVLDDEIYEKIVCKLECPAVLLSDTCHSGTMFDLPYTFDPAAGMMFLNTKRKGSSLGVENMVISLSACADGQLSMCDVGDITGFGGSLTTSVLNLKNVLIDLVSQCNVTEVAKRIQQRVQPLGQQVVLSCNKNQI